MLTCIFIFHYLLHSFDTATLPEKRSLSHFPSNKNNPDFVKAFSIWEILAFSSGEVRAWCPPALLGGCLKAASNYRSSPGKIKVSQLCCLHDWQYPLSKKKNSHSHPINSWAREGLPMPLLWKTNPLVTGCSFAFLATLMSPATASASWEINSQRRRQDHLSSDWIVILEVIYMQNSRPLLQCNKSQLIWAAPSSRGT